MNSWSTLCSEHVCKARSQTVKLCIFAENATSLSQTAHHCHHCHRCCKVPEVELDDFLHTTYGVNILAQFHDLHTTCRVGGRVCKLQMLP